MTKNAGGTSQQCHPSTSRSQAHEDTPSRSALRITTSLLPAHIFLSYNNLIKYSLSMSSAYRNPDARRGAMMGFGVIVESHSGYMMQAMPQVRPVFKR